jgi:hypothetical protein
MKSSSILYIVTIIVWSNLAQAEPVNFDQQIRPLLEQKCHSCHGPAKQEGGLRLDSKKWTLKGGDSGAALTANNHEKSELYQRIISTDPDLRMPAKADAFTKEEQELIYRWVKEGANWTENEKDKLADRDPRLDHWSFQPIKNPVPPKLETPQPARNPIDQFILSKAQEQGLTFSNMADRRTLIRRMYVDLLGISPVYEDVQSFIKNTLPDAETHLADELLASPHYGERYGRHWLDIARYADTMGYNFVNDNRHYFAWTYRDYIIRAFNDDLPYDRFLKDQLAADLVHKGKQDQTALAALGFLTIGGRFIGDEHGRTDDQIDVITRGLMGLTMQCARCHAHKYDPLSMGDYYALFGVMRSTHEPINYGEVASTITNLPVIAPPYGTADQVREYEQKVQQELDKLRDLDVKTLEKIRKELEEKAKPYIAKVKNHPYEQIFLREPIIKQYQKVLEEDGTLKAIPFPELKDDQISLIAERVKARITLENLKQFMIQSEENNRTNKEKELGKLHGSHPGAPTRAMALYENDKPYKPVIFLRGNDNNRGDQVPRRFIEIFNTSLNLKNFEQGSGRVELADAITHPKNPLTARVIVNRLWMWHFGQGIVRTPGDFGLRGELPTHPELLDYLANYLIEHDWSIKAVQRLIVTSATYQLSSTPTPEALKKDPENRLWTHQNIRRLEMEPLRDTLLQHTIGLDDNMGGQPAQLFDAPYPVKRTVYGFVDRYKIDQEFRTFDFASVETSCPQRPYTTVPQQSLFMLNHELISQLSTELAQQIINNSQDKTDGERISTLYRKLFQRQPTQNEITRLEQYLATELKTKPDQQNKQDTANWTKISHALLMSNEFLFVD